MEKEQRRDPLWSPLREKGFRSLYMGQVLSDFANWLDFVALGAMIVYAWGHGSMALAALSVCMGLPYIVIGPWVSVRLQGLAGKKILIICDLLRALFVFGMAWAPSLPVLLGLVLLKNSMSAIFDPVRQSAVKKFVNRSLLAQASSLCQLSVNLMKIVGPASGGAFMAWLGMTVPFYAGSALYVVSAAILCLLPVWHAEGDRAANPSGRLRTAWQQVMQRPVLRTAMFYVSSVFFLIFLFDGLIALLAREAGMNEGMFGLLIGAVGAGSVAGAITAGQWNGWKRRPLVHMTLWGMVSGCLVSAAGLCSIGWFQAGPVLWLTLFAMLGFCGAQSTVPFGYILQSETTDETIGTAAALSNALQTSATLMAPVLGALLAAWWKVGFVFFAAGIGIAGLAAWYRYRTAAPSEQPVHQRSTGFEN